MFTIGSQTFGNGVESAITAKYQGSNATLRQIASENLTKPNIIARKAEIQAYIAKKVDYCIETYQQELESARKRAQDLKQPSAEVSAIVAKGRSMGYDKDNEVNKEQTVIIIGPKRVESEVIENE